LKVEDLSIPDEVKAVLIGSGISELYPPQEDAIKAGALEGRNLVLASPTASGKTLVAELCALKHVVEKDGKVLYLTPLRALASEKYAEFQRWTQVSGRRGGRVRIGISTGDFDSSDPWLGRYNVIITTNEKADSLLRHRADWMGDISLVVADEVHLLNDGGRGPTLEVTLARMMQVNPKAQFLALSATIRNADEIADWLKASIVSTEWRPVKLVEGVYLGGKVEFNDGSSYALDEVHRNPSINLANHIVRHGGQALVFTETRKRSVNLATNAAPVIKKTLSKPEARTLEQIAKSILASGERTRLGDQLAEHVKHGVAFHHAGLPASHRRIIENSFREGKIKIVVATPTLAAGVNLPARMVVVSSYMRYEAGYGRYPIPVLEYKQMAGRAGRPKYDKLGEAVLIADSEDEQDFLMEKYILADPEKIWSKLGVEGVLRSHVLATIASGFAHTEQGLLEFFDRTFYAYQYDPKRIRPPIAKVLKFLYDEEMIASDGRDVYPTKFGRRVSELYIDPVSGVVIRDALYKRADPLTELSFVHMVSHTPDVEPKLYPRGRELKQIASYVDTHESEFMCDVPSEWDDSIQYEAFLGEVKCALVANSWIDEVTEDSIIERYGVEPGDLFRLIQSVDWLLFAAHELGALFGHKDLLGRISELRERVGSGVRRELLPLVRLEGVGRVRGRSLFNAGLRTVEDLKRAEISQLVGVPMIGPRVAKRIKEQVGGLVKKEEWTRLRKKGSEQKLLSSY
jgi:helicase